MNAALDTTPGVLLLDQTGRVSSATHAARQLLELVATPHDIPASLRALSARSAISDGHPVVIGLPIQPQGRLVLTAAPAGRQLAVIVEAQGGDVQTTTIAALTARERDVLELVTQGLPTKRIAAQLQISPFTVTDHLRSIFSKAGVTNRSELSALVHERTATAA